MESGRKVYGNLIAFFPLPIMPDPWGLAEAAFSLPDRSRTFCNETFTEYSWSSNVFVYFAG
jgi:hypothetical protein